MLDQAKADPTRDPFEDNPHLGPIVDALAAELRDPATPPGRARHVRGWFEWMGLGLPRDLEWRGEPQRALVQHVYRNVDRKAKTRAKSKAATAHANRYNRDGLTELLNAVRQSGPATSKVEYDRWRAAQPSRADLPTYKTVQRTMSGKTGRIDHRKPGESAWSAAVRLARKRKP